MEKIEKSLKTTYTNIDKDDRYQISKVLKDKKGNVTGYELTAFRPGLPKFEVKPEDVERVI